ncbi:MAG: c-type cytochrome [Anaerolineales bacterium]
MRTILKWIGIILGVLILLVVVIAGALFIRGQMLYNKKYETPAIAVTVPTDAAAVERGHHLATVTADCVGCHGPDLGGGVVIDDPALGLIVAPNLTTGQNGIGGQLSDEDIARVLRYGVKPDGHSVVIMPADDFTHLTDTDLTSIIAYIRSVPPVDSSRPAIALKPLPYFLLAAGQLPIVIAERIDFSKVAVPAPITPGPTAEYGAYIVSITCQGCHGAGLSGGHIPGTPPDFPKAANLTPSGEVSGWAEADFAKAIRTGITPTGRQLAPEMPWQTFVNLTDDEVSALWQYVHTVPARPAETR